ncbi:NAD-dependent epimerase/dehydratase family protein [Riemerella columbina]|uniref:NAD-dependent epimerase/dehydratase family protein n=1 Tax=Riemerella columbina TaxID=103810 RepID=UPI00266FCF05|nr:NAD-dependent epimerase/dehydratase family protein [Riemerella columbina]WKS95144.1 NAD-dependent epimerase/dehydratase family protein [Riemerella columbina]
MIVGNGLVAQLFKDTDSDAMVFFASGVSNSLETDQQQFLREENLIRQTIAENRDKIFVYFSTCSVYDSSKTESPYVLHKLRMEQLIAEQCPHYMILRVSNVVGKGGNPNLLMNYLIRAVRAGETINVHTKATRNLIDAEDVKNITIQLIAERKLNRIVNLAYLENYGIIEILQIIERQLDLSLNLNLIKTGAGYQIAIPDVERYFIENQLSNKERYISRMLERYYL